MSEGTYPTDPDPEVPGQITAHGGPIHFAPVQWPTEETEDPTSCGNTCGDWKPYTRFQNSLNDPRVQDPSNGGTAPQNYVNIASSCIDKDLPSIYYHLKKDANDSTKDVIMFRWRVEQIANTYATGPNPGTYGATHPWNSGLWTVLFDIDGTGYRDLAAHLDGSSGTPSRPIDMLAGIYGRIPTQSIDYINDPNNISLLAHNPTAFVNDTTNLILNFQNDLNPVASWLNGSAETIWDYGTSRAIKVSTRSCTEYFVDYQIPVAMLDATDEGGPKVDRSTPISMLFCTANSLNNPFQKDCALNRAWAADPNAPAPFGDYISFDQDKPYAQPIIREVKAEAPASCDNPNYRLLATVQDTLWVNNSTGDIQPSVKAVSFWYYHDADGDGVSDDGGAWTRAADATLVAGTLNQWEASWDAGALPKGRFLIGVQALDDNVRLDDDMTASGVDNRTFSYVTSNALGEVYINGDGTPWKILGSNFPSHSPSMSVSTSENWYGNPAIVGTQVATAGVDLALNVCGVAPTIAKTASPENVAVGEEVTYSISITNPATNNAEITVSKITDMLPTGFTYVSGTTEGDFTTSNPDSITGQTLTWSLDPAISSVDKDTTKTLSFKAIAADDAGTYNNQASAFTSFGAIDSDPVPVNVVAARLSITKTPSTYLIKPDGTTELIYTIAWSNDSAVQLTGATITDVLPTGVNYVSCSGGTSCGQTTGTVTWQLGNLAAGASGQVTLTVTVASSYPTASLPNTATIMATAPDGNPVTKGSTATIAIDVPAPAFTLEKTANLVRVAPAGDVTWTLTY